MIEFPLRDKITNNTPIRRLIIIIDNNGFEQISITNECDSFHHQPFQLGLLCLTHEQKYLR